MNPITIDHDREGQEIHLMTTGLPGTRGLVTIATLSYAGREECKDAMLDYARVMAAVPELLAAMEMMTEGEAIGDDDWWYRDLAREALDIARGDK